ncbi:hypothetical protein K488DRAFT_20762, partial [Vararia minispora EC-137]
PGSPSRNSLYDATATVDDLTRSLSNFSRVATPEPPDDIDAAYTRALAWLAVKSKLESRLVLSAEVGQALLQRHEAYVRKRDRESRREPSVDEASVDELQEFDDEPRSRVELEARIAELVQENAVLEKRFNQAFLNAEVIEAANRDLQDEAQDLHAAVSRLNTEHAKSVGWEARLRTAIQERDDYRQERDAESQRARLAENRLVALADKNAELRAQMRQLTDSVDQNYRHRQELSEEILHDARGRLAKLHATVCGSMSLADDDEIMGILDSLVADNEVLVRSNTELQSMLVDAREELLALQEEAEEHRASTNDILSSSRPSSRMHRALGSRMTYGTAPGPVSPLSSAFSARRGHRHQRSSSIEIPRREFVRIHFAHVCLASRRSLQEPLTPRTNTLRSLSPDPFDAPGPSFQPMVAPASEDSTLANKFDECTGGLTRSSPRGHKPGFPYQQDRAVQTDDWTGSLFSGNVGAGTALSDFSSSISPNDGLSESSSLAENGSTLGSLLDRISQLFVRMVQSDALTLTTRLRRQNIAGADVGYISRTTVESIISEVTGLRGALRGALEDENFTTVCTRKDLRMLLKLFRDLFRELGSLRIMLNNIVLDPAIAPKVRDMVFHPQKAEEQAKSTLPAPASGWMAPLSKFFGGTNANTNTPGYLAPSGPGRPSSRTLSRPIPKVPAAPSASTTTVNVEFTGTGVGRAVTESSRSGQLHHPVPAPTPSRNVSSSVMGIFAGAPKSNPSADPWVVVKAASKFRVKTPGPGPENGNERREHESVASQKAERRVSRNVEAMMLDRNEDTGLEAQVRPLLQRTLRPRGLSDSSIHSTFLQHDASPAPPQPQSGPPGRQPAPTPSVFQRIS